MRKLSIALAVATSLVAGESLFGGNTEAAVVVAPNDILAAANTLNAVQNVQVFYWHGRRYCWYDDGWNGQAGTGAVYAWRCNLGWGGGWGWHGWYHRGRDHRRHDHIGKPHDHIGKKHPYVVKQHPYIGKQQYIGRQHQFKPSGGSFKPSGVGGGP
jgi:hypothetical protein